MSKTVVTMTLPAFDGTLWDPAAAEQLRGRPTEVAFPVRIDPPYNVARYPARILAAHLDRGGELLVLEIEVDV